VTLEAIRRFSISQETVDQTERALREAGREGHERFTLWTGTKRGERFSVDHLYVPPQRGYQFDDGLCVRVGADALHELNVWLYRNQQVLGVQIHTHPQQAYHSETDDTYPIVTTLGGLSLVVPRFAREGLLSRGLAVYRLSADGWIRQPANATSSLLSVY
jgi:hypothetical protein